MLGSPPTPGGAGFCGTGGNFTTSKIGFAFRAGGPDPSPLNFVVAGATATVPLNISSTGTLSLGAWHVLGVSIDEAGGGGASIWLIDDDATETFDATYTSPSASAATETFEILGSGAGTGLMPNLTRIAGLLVWNTNLSAANMTAISAQIQQRFGI